MLPRVVEDETPSAQAARREFVMDLHAWLKEVDESRHEHEPLDQLEHVALILNPLTRWHIRGGLPGLFPGNVVFRECLEAHEQPGFGEAVDFRVAIVGDPPFPHVYAVLHRRELVSDPNRTPVKQLA